MTDKIGVLGEATTTSVGTTTVYTVPASKASKIRIMWAGEAHASTSTGDLTITVNGIVVAERLNFPTGEEFWSNSTTLIHDPSVSVPPDGSTAALTCSPAPQEYYLSAGDTVTYTITTLAMVAMNMQVVGTEIDV
jgi:hypothetical protein